MNTVDVTPVYYEEPFLYWPTSRWLVRIILHTFTDVELKKLVNRPVSERSVIGDLATVESLRRIHD